MDAADLADAAAAAERMCARGTAELGRSGPHEAAEVLRAAAVRLLQAAGGDAVADTARRYLEEVGATEPGDAGPVSDPRARLLCAARALFTAAEAAELRRLKAAGLTDETEQEPRRRQRISFVHTALAARRDAVLSVLAVLAALSAGDGR